MLRGRLLCASLVVIEPVSTHSSDTDTTCTDAVPRFGQEILARIRRRTRLSGRRLRDPILVYQMGKVGSASVPHSLESLDLDVPIHHVHVLTDFDSREEHARRTRPNPTPTLDEIGRGRVVRELIDDAEYERLSVITMVRDPIARNVSAFFQNLLEHIPDALERRTAGTLDVDDCIESFFAEYIHDDPSSGTSGVASAWPLTWFDDELRAVFGIDVYCKPFPRELGYCFYDRRGVRVLLIRLEDLDACVGPAMRAFLGIRRFKLLPSNRGEAGEYADIYRSFLDRVRLPDRYIETMYGSRFATHFYTPAELAGFARRWRKAPV